ncbi:hypothetical protein [Geomonas propionica]|uniref:CopG family transcriptional regulator n=1 Tax=Geomonas propionica TaxID=2798582 RepID=A0ABS0YVW1_9BACT|nr:hypothetical protein [Geomonas propionica]MBJ6802068.1 hypothetical protein [Geomonas propionica]
MQQKKIFTHLSTIVDPSETVFSITMETILLAITQRLGEKALALNADELLLAREEVRIAIDHHLDEQEYINIGLDTWEITRTL